MTQSGCIKLDRIGGGVLALLCAAVAATCAARGKLVHQAVPPTRTAASAPAVVSTAPAAESAREPVRAWPRFCTALQKLEAKERDSHVRVIWLGDSHTYADFWSHAVRRRLQQAYGNGGPGFIHLGLGRYRHGGIRPITEGEWRQEPAAPSRSSRQIDGVFGLGGIRAVPDQAAARAGLLLLPGAVSGTARYEVYYRLPDERARFEVAVDAQQRRAVTGPVGGVIVSQKLEGEALGKLEVTQFSGAPQLFGVVVESSTPGVVIDALGINGARASTPLSWEESSWVPLVRQRAFDLAVIAYGTNEVVATEDPARYEAHFAQLLQRLRGAEPDLDCLMIGPTDVGHGGDASHPRVSAIDAMERKVAADLGCLYFSAWQAMGGEGGQARWAAEQPALAQSDRVHLTAEGYARIGDQIADLVLRTCR